MKKILLSIFIILFGVLPTVSCILINTPSGGYEKKENKINYIVISNDDKSGMSLFDSYWMGAMGDGVEAHGFAYSYPQTYKSDEGAFVGPLLYESFLPVGANSGSEYLFDGYFLDESCTIPCNGVTANGVTGSYTVEIVAGTTGNITIYVKMNNVGSWATSPW